ncbi:hypothetical protein [Cytobacillus sp.]|uniref:hypothetical protein n=1 Tax=Cytobacillus sp. TaxID=2675269 RepID=UPI0028BEF8E2|nr:hypothetical protein [Cytobacillus sp.]
MNVKNLVEKLSTLPTTDIPVTIEVNISIGDEKIIKRLEVTDLAFDLIKNEVVLK